MAEELAPEQQIWVMPNKGGELTEYNARYLEQLARKNLQLPEDEGKSRFANGVVALNYGYLTSCTTSKISVTAHIRTNPKPRENALLQLNMEMSGIILTRLKAPWVRLSWG